MKRTVALQVNGKVQRIEVDDADTLLEVLRRLRLWSIREGCGVGACGSCTVLLDGRPASSCILLASRVEDRKIQTVEGLTRDGELHPIQEAFIEQRALQCGYCTPGFILAVKALLDEYPNPTDDEMRDYLTGNLCRCGGYRDILRAVRVAQEKLARAASG